MEEGSAVDERPTAVRTGAWGRRFDYRRLLWREVETEGEMDEGGDPVEGDGGGWVEEAVVADLHEAFGKHVLEESEDELGGTEGHGSPSIGVGLLVAEEDGMVADLQDSAVGDGDAEDVWGEVLDGAGAVSHGLGVDDPGDVPDLGPDLLKKPCFFHLMLELGPVEDGEGLDGEEEISTGWMPGVVLGRDGSSGDDIVDVGVVVELAAPGVKDAPEAREIPSHVLGISSQGGHGLRRGCEHSIVRGALVAADEGVELLGSGEGDQEMVPWHLPLHLVIKPALSFLVLAGGAVAISAGSESEVGFSASLALIEGRSEGGSSAVDHGADDLEVVVGDGVVEPVDVVLPIGAEDIVDGFHGS